ncbi:MAG: hypothetical protein N4A57_04880 [Anaeromicrobium sp.]|uniref:hypothetical protein n=1 Tax=Anaeromicrobium sp. TaxID=1929132 RepID=UPI0025FC3521|nr:hypothetical protein [Anaeromicrobium sp.]MCT4593592.1 hypothetical protein [Anaeromicrobium sp.]
MANNTKNLGLYKKDPVSDSNDYFDVKTMLNDNWDKVDEKCKDTDDRLTGIENEVVTHKAETGDIIKNITGKNDWKTNPRTTLENAVKRDGDTLSGNLEIKKSDNQDSHIGLYESNGLHGVTIKYEASSEGTSDGIHILGKDNGVEREGIYFPRIPTVEGLTYMGHKVWHQGNDGSGSSLDADCIDGIQGVELARRVDFDGQITTSYRKVVIALCRVDNDYINRNSYSLGTLYFHRTNGLYGSISIDVLAEKRYNTEQMHITLTVKGSRPNIVKPCTFKYNGITYGGIEYYPQPAETRKAFFVGETSGDIFIKEFYNTNDDSVLNSEIYNSLNYDNAILVNYLNFCEGKVWTELNSFPIVEQGSNSNGTYVKFADGTLICYTSIHWTTWGSYSTIFPSGILQRRTKTHSKSFPATFSNTPHIITSLKNLVKSDGYNGELSFSGCTIFSSTKTSLEAQAWCISDDIVEGYQDIIAIGRWK